mmetsp:Transcript_123253/g.213801  ORF Transcript_123253/g.213801 Transcript_123253/m.213801 type:complete len:200 (-) Transcript_123253:120-719(-)
MGLTDIVQRRLAGIRSSKGTFHVLEDEPEKRVLMLGLDAAGKATMLNQLKLDEVINSTVGFNVESFRFANMNFTVWDCGSQDKIRPFWSHYYRGTEGMIFVVDSSDKSRIEEASTVLAGLLAEEAIHGVPLLVLANKQDLPGALNVDEITEKLKLRKLKGLQWSVQPTCGTEGHGLHDALGWLACNMHSTDISSKMFIR